MHTWKRRAFNFSAPLERDELRLNRPLAPFVPAEALAHAHISKATRRASPLPSPRERLRVVGRGRGWGAFVRNNCTTPHPARRLPAPRHPPHPLAGGGMAPATPSLPISKMCACASAEASGDPVLWPSSRPLGSRLRGNERRLSPWRVQT